MPCMCGPCALTAAAESLVPLQGRCYLLVAWIQQQPECQGCSLRVDHTLKGCWPLQLSALMPGSELQL